MRTEVPKFGLLVPQSVGEAVSMLTQYGAGNARVISGGTDIITRMKNGIAQHTPKYLIDISGLGLNYIKQDSGGLRIGSATPISDVVNSQVVASAAPLVAAAAGSIATLQLRNNGTIGGDVLQEVWCPYLRNNYPCWRNGGNVCYGAIGDNRYYHSIFGGRLCYAVNAGDIPPALFALNAQATVQGSSIGRTVSMDALLPGINVIGGRVQEHTVDYNEILTEFFIPNQPSGTKSGYYKVRDRGTWDFAMASAAITVNTSGGSVSNAHVVLGGLGVVPHRATGAEGALNGKALGESVYSAAAAAAVQDATPLDYGTGNAFRVELAKGAVVNALRALS
jgi:xanthine dehydrogenase YagS FAD-binding subunit